jgi:hypothetical protein
MLWDFFLKGYQFKWYSQCLRMAWAVGMSSELSHYQLHIVMLVLVELCGNLWWTQSHPSVSFI